MNSKLKCLHSICIAVSLHFSMCCSCYSQQSLMTLTNLVLASVQMNNSEIDLGQQLFPITNSDTFSSFEKAVFESVGADVKIPQGMSFQQVTCVFHYPATNDCLESFTEMAHFDRLLYKNGHVTRTNSTCSIPLDRIRLVDSSVKNT